MEQELLLVRGLPGSGKTTEAKKRIDGNTIHIENDIFHMINDEYDFKEALVKDAYMWVKGNVCYCLNQGNNVVVSNTFISNKTINEYVKIGLRYNCKIKIIEMKEHYGNVHDVPRMVLGSMKKNWQELDEENVKYLVEA